jgi:sulfite reductase (NADPH) flavoprotein alpha-component
VYVSFDISGTPITYKCGDALGVYPSYNAAKVEALLGLLGFGGSEPVRIPRDNPDTLPVREAFTSRLSLRTVSRGLLQLAHDRAGADADKSKLAEVLAAPDPQKQRDWLEEREVEDIFAEFRSSRPGPQELVDQLRKLTPRLYSISSSFAKDPTRVDLTVAVVRYRTNGRDREGVCSNFLARYAPLHECSVPVFVAPSHFAPPEEDTAPLIMVGPGAGVAPFYGFLQERAFRRAAGKTIGPNWLFFGDRHEKSDFLYREELLAWKADGLLTRLSTAWSRDQIAKIYVQNRMLEEGAELWRWLESGAYFHVCGDAKRMAKDVEAALQEIVEKHGGMTPKDAQNYISILRHSGRYQRDVY